MVWIARHGHIILPWSGSIAEFIAGFSLFISNVALSSCHWFGSSSSLAAISVYIFFFFDQNKRPMFMLKALKVELHEQLQNKTRTVSGIASFHEVRRPSMSMMAFQFFLVKGEFYSIGNVTPNPKNHNCSVSTWLKPN